MDTVTKTNRDIKSLQPIAQMACELFLSECKKRNIPIFITETHRSQARQNYLYEQGRTRPGNIVTWTKSSNHTGGYAWDIAVNPPHDLYDSSIIAKAGAVAKELGIEWGGAWKEKDTPHFQINKSWKSPIQKEVHKVNTIKISINGIEKEVHTVNIDGNNFIKIQDIKDDKIVVGYDAAKKIPTITTK